MDPCELNSYQFIPHPINRVFGFFSKPENLEKITPNTLHFKILADLPIDMKVDQEIDYKIRIRGIPMRWRSKILSYDPPNSFIDEQIKGPYALWHHTHNFIEKDGGTYIHDIVKYKIPYGFIGRFLNKVWISKDLNSIFSYRKHEIAKFFNCKII